MSNDPQDALVEVVRAKVHAIEAGQYRESADAWRECDRYLAVAPDLTTRRRPLLAITRGLSGSGKTTIGDALIARLPALRVRSDLERKRLHGLAARDRSVRDDQEGSWRDPASAV